MRWSDVIVLETSTEARQAIQSLVEGMSTAAEAAEIVGARYAREVSTSWYEPSPHIDAWRERIAGAAFIRWESAARERLIEDEILDACARLEQRAAHLGVRLGRVARHAIADRLQRRGGEP